MIIAIIGSRRFTNMNIEKYIPKEITKLVSGGARGIDTLAELWANRNNIPTEIILPDYNSYGSKFAPIMRNKTIVNKADKVIAIWDGKSRGTSFTINYAEMCKVPTEVHIIEV